MRSRFFGLLTVAAILAVTPAASWAQKVDTQTIRNLKSQQTDLETRIANLQREVDDAYAGKVYCSAEERQEDLRKLRAIRVEIAKLRKDYADFKAGFIKLAATPTAGPQFDAVGIHPEDRSYWTDDDNALQKLNNSSLAKADRVENATFRDCNEKKATSAPPPAKETPPSSPPETGKTQPVASPEKGPTVPLGGCTDRQRHDAILRLQEEILRLEEELIPIDGTKPEGRARQLQLTAEIKRLQGLLGLDCPPFLPPLKPSKPPPTTPLGPTKPLGESPPIGPRKPLGEPPKTSALPKPWPVEPPNQFTGVFYFASLEQLEDEADYTLEDLADAMDDCDVDDVKRMIPYLEELSRRAHAEAIVAARAWNAGKAAEASALARDLDEAIRDAKEFKCPTDREILRRLHLLNSDERAILQLHNGERAEFHVQPLKWNFKLAWGAIGYANELAEMHQLQHAPREGRGIVRENLAKGLLGWSPVRIVKDEWVDREKPLFHPGIFPDVCTGGSTSCWHLTQIIWDTTTDVGCGWAVGGGFRWIVCRYSPGGNKDGKPVGYGALRYRERG